MRLTAYALIALPLLLICEALWIMFAGGFYLSELGGLLRDTVLWPAALTFFFVFSFGIAFFCVEPAVRFKSPHIALANGALLGLMAYAAFNLMGLATIEGWPPFLSIVDIAWGVVLTGVVAFCTSLLALHLLKH